MPHEPVHIPEGEQLNRRPQMLAQRAVESQVPDRYQHWITPEKAAVQTGLATATIYYWIRHQYWTPGVEYVTLQGQCGRAGRSHLIDPTLFAAFQPGETYYFAAQAARYLQVSNKSFARLASVFAPVLLPRRSRYYSTRLYPLSQLSQWKQDHPSVFKPGETYLTVTQAASELGVSRQRVHQLRKGGRLEAISSPNTRNRWAYPLSNLTRLKKGRG